MSEPTPSPGIDPTQLREAYALGQQLLIAKRYSEALKLYSSLAERGVEDADLFLQLGWMHHKGQGTSPDAERADQWFECAAKRGSAIAQCNLAASCVSRHAYDEARVWLERAAEQGFTPAIYHLGRMYELGRWGPLDTSRALSYFEAAAAKGHVWAQRQLGVMFLKGHRGVRMVPKGLMLFAGAVVRAWRLSWQNPESEYLKA